MVFGVSGQDGAYLSQLLLNRGYVVHGTSRDAEISVFPGLKALGIAEKVTVHSVAVTDFRSVMQIIALVEPDEIYNLSGQSSVGLSFLLPVEALESISIGTLNILETLRIVAPHVRFYNAGSSECFGETGGGAANEATAFHPRSPYAVAKAAAYWQVANYRDGYGLFVCSGMLFNHESPLRPPRFVTRKVVATAARIAADGRGELVLGNLAVERDWGWAPEYVDAMWRMLQAPDPDDYVIATGESHSLEAFVAAAFSEFGLNWRDHVRTDQSLFRPSDIRRSKGDATKAAQRLNWRAQTRMTDVVRRMSAAERG